MWAIGIILYEMLTGRRAFDGSSMASLAQKIKRGQYRPVSSSYSQDVRALLKNLLTLSPKARPTADDVLRQSLLREALSTFVSEVIVRSKPHESKPAQQPKLGEGTREISLALLNMHNGEKNQSSGGAVASVNSLARSLPIFLPRAFPFPPFLSVPSLLSF
jgi:serine/threonine protein kinase